jgi:uncharacterized protein YceK
MARGSGVATSPVEARTAPNMQAEAQDWTRCAARGPVSWDAQLEGCGAVRRHVTGGSTHCPQHAGKSLLAAQRVQSWACPLGWRGSAVWLWSRWLDVALAWHDVAGGNAALIPFATNYK